MRFFLTEALKSQKYEVETAASGSVALDLARNREFDCVIMDIRMANMNGIETLEELKEIRPDIPVIMMTAFGSKKVAVETMQKGAYDYFTKPFDINEMRIVVKRALEKRLLEEENKTLRRKLEREPGYTNIIGDSPLMQEIFEQIDKVKNNDVTVLIQGESGTGKELVATVLHEQGLRRDMPLVKINCAAIPETLLESEMFGHEKGAFTGAGARKIGKFQAADHGTLFLDEIGDMSLTTQAKLLRVLEEQEFERIGGNESIKVDLRIITATNQDLRKLVEEKKFREDLFFRLNVVPIYLPPLRARKEDLPALAGHFLEDARSRHNLSVEKIDPDVMRIFMSYSWPGNVRELANMIQRAAVMSQDNVITCAALPAQMRDTGPAPQEPHLEDLALDGSLQEMMDNIVSTAEKQLIEEALNRTDWSRTKTAKLLKICRKSLHNKMKKYGLLEKDAGVEQDAGGQS